jgi:septal ring factor EnvC (AmiA/AmiB activator)
MSDERQQMKRSSLIAHRSSFRAIGAAFLVALLMIPSGSSQTKNPDLDRVRRDIARLRKRLDDVRQQAKSAERELEEVDLELDIHTQELQLAIETEEHVVAQQQETEAAIAALIPRIERQKTDLRHRLVALYRLGSLSYLRMLLELENERNPVQAMSMLSYLVSRDARAVSRFQETQQQLAGQRVQLAARQRELHETRLVVEQRRRAVASAHAQKQALLTRLRTEETGSAQQLAALEEKARRLERLVTMLAQQKRGELPPAGDISSVRGALAWPVDGEVVERFGKQRNPKFSTVTMNNGLKIEAVPGAPVRAVFQGTVLFSQWFKGYGNLIILDHGNRVFSLYGNLKTPAVAVGDRITTGQSIAGVGESDDALSGYLYFEIREDNHPVDPQKWLR